jgi:hypothetical protein
MTLQQGTWDELLGHSSHVDLERLWLLDPLEIDPAGPANLGQGSMYVTKKYENNVQLHYAAQEVQIFDTGTLWMLYVRPERRGDFEHPAFATFKQS